MMKYRKLLTCFLASTSTVFFSSQAFATVFEAPADDQSDRYSVGIEGFHDHYFEPQTQVTDSADYGGVTADWTHAAPFHDQDRFLFGLDGEFAHGTDSYRSPSGIADGASQDAFDGRVLTGIEFGAFPGGSFSPYIGLGVRYYVDNGKGEVTNLGFHGYDRRITQVYFPMGITYSHPFGDGWSLTPNIEFDQLIQGDVNSRLQNIPGGYNVNNTQSHNGYGLRAEMLVGKQLNKVTIEAGPFIRYWNFSDSNFVVTPGLPPGYGWVEPSNTRVQYGGEIKISW